MKTIIIITLLFSALMSKSQTDFGISSGLNLSKAVYIDDADEQLVEPYRKLKPGFFAGFYVRNNINEVLSVQADLLYSQKGLKFYQVSANKSINSMNYLELPVIGSYNLTNNSFLRFDAYIGGYVAYWLDGKYKYTDLRADTTDIKKVNFNNDEYNYNRIDAGILAGFSYTSGKIRVFMKYTHSMTGSAEENADALTNRVFSFGLNYAILDN